MQYMPFLCDSVGRSFCRKVSLKQRFFRFIYRRTPTFITEQIFYIKFFGYNPVFDSNLRGYIVRF